MNINVTIPIIVKLSIEEWQDTNIVCISQQEGSDVRYEGKIKEKIEGALLGGGFLVQNGMVLRTLIKDVTIDTVAKFLNELSM